MNKFTWLNIMVSALLLSACASKQAPTVRVFENMRVGILDGSRLRHLPEKLARYGVKSDAVLWLDEKDLNNELKMGNIDIAIGLPLTDDVLEQYLWTAGNMDLRQFQFYLRADDKRKLHKYMFASSFFRQAKKIGYISNSEKGVVNKLIVKQAKQPGNFVACGDSQSCIDDLLAGRLDALFCDRQLFNLATYHHKIDVIQFEKARIDHEQAFAMLINQRTVSIKEYAVMRRLVASAGR